MDLEMKQITRELWLSEFGADEGDVMEDSTGVEYILVENESEFGDDYQLIDEKVALPEELQHDYVSF